MKPKNKTKASVRQAKLRGTKDQMPVVKGTITRAPKEKKEKTLVGKLKDAFTSDKEKQRKAKATQSLKPVTQV